MTRTVFRDCRVVGLPAEQGLSRSAAFGQLATLARADVTVDKGQIRIITPVLADSARKRNVPRGTTEVLCHGRVLMPGFIDAHTHACFAGSRYEEWEQKRRGVPYLEILRRGGGIMSTVRATRAASEAELAELLLERLWVMLRCGTTSVEVKSGYGLGTEHEMKMLRAIASAARQWPGTVRMTALLGHAIDEAQPGFVGITVRQTLATLAAEFPPEAGTAVDVFCEEGAWSFDQSVLLINRARELGFVVRAHADQFNALGLVAAAPRLGLASVDHLEVTGKQALIELAASATAGVWLPNTPLHLGSPQGKPRPFVEAGGAMCIASNYNPGSGPSASMPETIAHAVRCLNLTVPEAINAATINPSRLLRLPDRGVIKVGARADLLLLRHRDERALAFELGESGVQLVMCAGEIVHQCRRDWPKKSSTEATDA